MNQKDKSAIIAAIDRALAVFEGNPPFEADDARIYEALKKVRAEFDQSDTPPPPPSVR